MKNLFITLLFLFIFNQAIAQQYFVDSFKHKLAVAKGDTTKALLLDSLVALYLQYQPDSGFLYVRQGISLSQKIHYKYGEALVFMVMGSLLAVTGNYPKSLEAI